MITSIVVAGSPIRRGSVAAEAPGSRAGAGSGAGAAGSGRSGPTGAGWPAPAIRPRRRWPIPRPAAGLTAAATAAAFGTIAERWSIGLESTVAVAIAIGPALVEAARRRPVRPRSKRTIIATVMPARRSPIRSAVGASTETEPPPLRSAIVAGSTVVASVAVGTAALEPVRSRRPSAARPARSSRPSTAPKATASAASASAASAASARETRAAGSLGTVPVPLRSISHERPPAGAASAVRPWCPQP